MQHSAAARFLAGSLMLALSIALVAAPAAAQPEPSLDAVIATGNPPLTERMVERYAELQAWILEVPLTKEFLGWQRADLKEGWRNTGTVAAVLGMLGDAARLTPDDREFYRVAAQHHIVAALRTQSDTASQFYLASFAAAHTPIAPGDALLTESMVSHYVEFVAWLLEIPVTPAFAANQRASVVRSWKNPADVASLKFFLQRQLMYAEFKGGPLERDYARSLDQPVLIAQLRAHQENPDNRIVLAAFDAAHRSLAPGPPALTRQMSDAWTELYCLIRDQGLGEHLVADQATKDAFAAQLARQWPTFAADQQIALSIMPSRWASVRWMWSISQPADRAKIVAAWMPAVNPPAVATQRAGNSNTLAIAGAEERARIAAATARFTTTQMLLNNPAYAQVMMNATPHSPYSRSSGTRS